MNLVLSTELINAKWLRCNEIKKADVSNISHSSKQICGMQFPLSTQMMIQNFHVALPQGRASDILQEKKLNFRGFLGANLWKNQPKLLDFLWGKQSILVF